LTEQTRTATESELVATLAAGIAHEVRNPLNSVQINLQILDDELSSLLPDRQAAVFQVLGRIASEIKRLDDFVGEFLRFARPPGARLAPVAIRGVLGELAAFFGPECAARGVELRLDLERAPALATVDAFQMKQCVLNLLLNALQASHPGGCIVVRGEAAAGRLRLCVIDDGEGMSEPVLAQVFTAFFSTREGGTGLGLPIAERIARAHGGAIELSSTPGRGTTASVVLPLYPGS
jgi:signal transduction histidine kinase